MPAASDKSTPFVSPLKTNRPQKWKAVAQTPNHITQQNARIISNANRRLSLTVAEWLRQPMFANMDRKVMSATHSNANQEPNLNAEQVQKTLVVKKFARQ